ncbi:DUF1045 domain-containing protein [Variovorax sp. CAN2819]|uniref:DUF1045 domain-containing protein n=1 Tax=Variovorax sp. CAN15 TaxID=3046727 RepID=UPI0026475F45|nr:DUF1045 domain-containing protein [Variovorax sp. CAN15]MDN6882011.1 DUF1045 domain-containing protein [Variovorax sp. CAN15]
MSEHHRYAAYFAPPVESAWWEAGSRWLGRCAASGRTWPLPAIEGVPGELQQKLTAAPRRYGWHATLAAPLVLKPQFSEADLRAGMQALCRTLQPFDMPALEVALLGDFLALVPTRPDASLRAAADACVMQLHPFAEPLPPSELQRRRAAGLTPEEDALLLRWGYPFVMDRFRFHMSLTGSLRGVEPGMVAALQAAARQHFAPLLSSSAPLRFEAVSLFAEPSPGADFVCLAQMELGR